MVQYKYVIPLTNLGTKDINKVGGKNASLGELISQLSDLGIKVPGGFATTAQAFYDFLEHNHLRQYINDKLTGLDVNNVKMLAKVGAEIRERIIKSSFPPEIEKDITDAFKHYAEFTDQTAVAVRSSATAEDLPEASFAGQQETFLNIRGIENILIAIREVFASLYNDRAISYREHHDFAHDQVAISASVQKMVRSETASSGVMFTLDTESGFRDVVFITSAWGLGEAVVQGAVNPDEFYLYKSALNHGHFPILRRNIGRKKIKMVYSDDATTGKSIKTVSVNEKEQQMFSITDEEAEQLAKQALIIEKHYKRPMDIEWAKDGDSGELFIVQARPETVKSRQQQIERYILLQEGEILITGKSIGQRIGQGVARKVESIAEMDKVQSGDILITDMTDPDWEPVMKKAAAIVTNR
ncbi:MAG: phosphoenolpyruvate synthase, partial [Endozoicomonadaceae bacterium]|nr:phosphoenolpyruvate synthase [Endozoicomonadaceae bacterium]